MKLDEKPMVAFTATITAVFKKWHVANIHIRDIGNGAGKCGRQKSLITRCIIFDSS